MKKSLLALSVIAGLTLFSFKTADKPLKVEANVQQWNMVLQVIDQSNAPHAQVEEVKKFIVSQLQTQIQDSASKKK